MWRHTLGLTVIAMWMLPGTGHAESVSASSKGDTETASSKRLDILFTRPGCVHGEGLVSLSTVGALQEHFEHAKGTFQLGAGSLAALVTKDIMLMPEKQAADGLAVIRLLKEIKKLSPELVSERVSYLESPFDRLIELPHDSPVDWLQVIERKQKPHSRHPDIKRRQGRLLRFTLASGETFLAVVSGKGSFSEKIEDYQREFVVTAAIRSPDGHANFLSLGRAWASGHGLKAALDRTAKELGSGTLKLHLGNLVPLASELPWAQSCMDLAGKQGYTGLVPASGELAQGPTRLVEFSKKHRLNYSALNLFDAKTNERVFPAYRLVEIEGLKVAMIGLVGGDQLVKLPAKARSAWKVDSPILSMKRLQRQGWKSLGTRPDLIVVMVASGDAKILQDVREAWDVDIVLTHNTRNSMSLRAHPQKVRVEVPGNIDRSMTRFRLPLLAAKAGSRHLNKISAFFDKKVLRAVEHEQHGVRNSGEHIDPKLMALYRRLQEEHLEDSGRIFLPDVSDIIVSDPELERLTRGGRVLFFGTLTEREKEDWPFITDAVWGRMVANLMRIETEADVALCRNLPRKSMIVGPLAKAFLENWLSVRDVVVTVELSGAELRKVQALVAQSAKLNSSKLSEVLFAGGLNHKSGMVQGRPIDPKRKYRVALTDAVAEFSRLAGIISGKKREVHGELHDMSLAFFERNLSPETGNFDPKNLPVIANLLADHSKTMESRWDFNITELSITGAQYLNTGGTVDYSATKEARLATPDNLSLSGAMDISLVYDSASVGWETGFNAKIQRVDLDLSGVPAQEPFDDAVAYSELRLNAAKVSVGSADVRLVPYLRAAYDTEFTATLENPAVPDVTLPHQHLLRQDLGFVLYPGSFVREVRLGGLLQQDLSQSELDLDGGITLALKLSLPLGPVVLMSDNELRYLFPDGDDTSSDLGLVFKSSTKLAYPVTSWFSLFTFADGYLARGKIEGFGDFSGSFILGLGLKLNHSFQL